MSKTIVFGIGDLALLFRYLSEDSENEVVAFTVEKNWIKQSKTCNLPVIPFEQIQDAPPNDANIIIATGPSRINQNRARFFAEAKSKGYGLETYISSRAMVASEVKLGENCIISAGCAIEPFVSIADNTIMWSGSILAHHSTVGNHCFFAPSATVCGRVTIEDFSFLGANCKTRDHVQVSRKSLIGAGAVIQANTEPSGVYVKSATLLRDHRSSEIKL